MATGRGRRLVLLDSSAIFRHHRERAEPALCPQRGDGVSVREEVAGAGEELLPRVVKVAVHGMPGSGTPEELRDAAGISARHLIEAARSLAAGGAGTARADG